MTQQEVDKLQAGAVVCLHDWPHGHPHYGVVDMVLPHTVQINWTGGYGVDTFLKTSPVWRSIKVRK